MSNKDINQWIVLLRHPVSIKPEDAFSGQDANQEREFIQATCGSESVKPEVPPKNILLAKHETDVVISQKRQLPGK